MTLAVALKVAAEFGAKVIPIDVFCPAASVIGRVGEVNKKFWLEMATPLTVMDVVPELVTVKVDALVLPIATLPKATVVLPRLRSPEEDWLAVLGGVLAPPVLNP